MTAGRVWAFTPNTDLPDDLYWVANDDPRTAEGEGRYGDQCGTCGLTGWTIRVEQPSTIGLGTVMVCEEGHTRRVRRAEADQVIFP